MHGASGIEGLWTPLYRHAAHAMNNNYQSNASSPFSVNPSALHLAPMASTIPTREIIKEIPGFIRVYNDGTIERPWNTPIVPPSPEDPVFGVSSKDIVISENPAIAARLYLPKFTQTNQKIPILVYFRGGAFFFESAFSLCMHRYLNQLTSLANVMAVSVEYRQAPEHLLPATFNDCWDALKWVATHSTTLPNNNDPWLIKHGDFKRIFIGGDSAGGNIVHNIAIRAGAEELPGGVKVLGAYMNHPYFYGSEPIGSEPLTGREQSLACMAWNFAYPDAPGGIDNHMINPFVPGAPSLATLGCSKLLITVAGKDFLKLRDRGVWYYQAVKESWKGELHFHEDEDEDHVFYMNDPVTENSKKFMKFLAGFLSG